MKYHIYYFSATGNSENSAKMTETALRKAGHNTEIISIDSRTEPLPDKPYAVVLIFPTYAWRPPALVSNFINKLPKASGKIKAAVLAVAGGGPLGAPDVAGKKLQKRGYNLFLKAIANYSFNWTQVMSAPDKISKDNMNREGIQMTEDFIKLLLEGKNKRAAKKNPLYIFFNLMGMLFELLGRRVLGKLFIADDDCNSCRLCEKKCPANTIKLSNNKNAKPFWKFSCESCNKCINICPKKAINVSIARGIILSASVIILCIIGINIYNKYIPGFYRSFPSQITSLLNYLGYILVILISHIFTLTFADYLIIRPLQSLKPLRRIFTKSYSKKFNRYIFK
jgi:Pyruvate/2-oxoacid:ferredoxin oxidoreductase delta subunit/flavodoxin